MKNTTLFINVVSFRSIQGGVSHLRIIYLMLIVMIIGAAYANAATPVRPVHPRIYITPDGRDAFTAKLQSVAWAKNAYNNLKTNVDPYVDRHRTDPEWIVSRMQMYWDTHYERVYVKGNAFLYGKGRAPVPTVKFAGHRDGATDYLMPSLEDTQPYMDAKGMYLQNRKKEGRPWEWVHPSKTGRIIGPMNDRILALAADAAFFYWYTGEEKYAVFASDIFLTYVKGMYYRREPFALEDYSNSHLMGLATFEVILDHLIPYLALCYDFLYDYLSAHQADTAMITNVLKRFADQQIMYGVPDNNWNIFQARHVAYIALTLEDDEHYKDRRGRQYYLNEILNHTTIRQFALKEMVQESFDMQTGLWHESATYSMSVCNDMLDIISLIDNAENNRLLDTFPIMRKAILATAQYLFPNGRVTAFGDARYVPLRPQLFEMLIALYRKYGERENEIELTKALRKMMNDGFYNRNEEKSMFSLFFYVDKLMEIPAEDVTYNHLLSDMYYAPNVSWLIQRNGRDKQQAMSVTLTGSYGNHAHVNGISLEMYGKGLMLAPESSYGETYGTRDNQEYYARFPAHNTVVVDGISDYGMMRSDYPYRLLSCYPGHGEQLLPSEKVTFARTSLTEPKTNAQQERLTSIVRTNESSAYVVDIFRSIRNDRKDIKHEYFYHSIGQHIDIDGRDGREMSLLPTQELSSQSGDMKGYDYFSDKKSVATDDDFIARFHIELQQSADVSVRMWMKGFPGRTIFTGNAPKSNAFVKGSIPDELLGAPLPTLIVRQQGEAWNRPFVAVYHPYTEDEGASVREVEYFGDNEGFTGIKIESSTGTDYIFNRPENINYVGNNTGNIAYHPENGTEMKYGDIRFNGVYAVVSESADGLTYLFMGEGRTLEKDKWSIRSTTSGAQVSLYRKGDTFELITSSDILLEMPFPTGKPPVITVVADAGDTRRIHHAEDKQPISPTANPDKRIKGSVKQANVYAVALSAGYYLINEKEIAPQQMHAATNPDIESIRKRIFSVLMTPDVRENYIRELINTLRPDGTWPGINYADTTRTAFEHARHLANIVQMSRAYKKKGSPLAGNKALKKAFSSALDYWLDHDFICENWWNNEIGTPSELTAVLLIMDKDLSKEQIEKTSVITGRAHINAWGARQSGDRIKIAGIQAKNALFKHDAEQFGMLMKVVEDEIRFVPEYERGLQYDYSFHHRDDRVNNTLSYGLGYADTFIEWADYVAGTRYQFSEKPLQLLVDYYLDGICKMMIFGKYHDPGATNRDISRPRSHHAAGTLALERLLRVTTYRADELNEIVKIRRNETQPALSFSTFYWLTEHYTHQRSGYFTSVRMFSARVRNMEEPYNGEGLTNHHRGDGTNYLSIRGDEYFPITPVYDWQKIPGATILQKPALPPENEIQKAGITDFAGAATDGIYGVAGFDFISPHDPVRARKAWFFFDDEYVCLGAGITSASHMPLATTLNQSKLTGDVVAGQGNFETILPQGEHVHTDVAGGWLFHDKTGYIFPESAKVILSIQAQTGNWFKINRQTNSSREDVSMDVFKLWIDHGIRANNAGYCYIVMPATTAEDVKKAAANQPVDILSNTSVLQAVRHRVLNIVQAAFYQNGEITFADGIRLSVDNPALIMVSNEAGNIRRLTVSDPTRKLEKIHLRFNRKLDIATTSDNVQAYWNVRENNTEIAVALPQGGYAGKSVVVEFQ